MNPLKKLAGQTAIYGLPSIVGRLLNYLLVPLHTAAFVKESFGVIIEMYAYVAFLVVILTYGMETAYFRFQSKKEHKHAEVFSTVLFSLLISTSVFWLVTISFSQSIADLIDYPNHKEYVIWFAIIVGLDAISSIPLARLRTENKAIKFAAVNFASILVNIGLNLFWIGYCMPNYESGSSNLLIDNFYTPEIGVGYVFLANLFASIIKFLLLSPIITRVKAVFNRKMIKDMLLYSSPVLLASLAIIVNESVDKILIKRLLVDDLGVEGANGQVGIYGACYKLSIIITLFIQAFRYAAEPFFFNQSDQKDAKKTYATVMKYFTIVCAFIFIGVMLYIDVLKHFISNSDYYEGLHVVPILLFANIFLGMFYNLSIWYKLSGKTRFGAYIASFGALITIVLNLIFIPIYGYTASAWATLICYGSMVAISYWLGQKHYPVPYPIGKMLFYLTIALGIYGVSKYLNLEVQFLKYTVHTVLMLMFIAMVYVLEKPKKPIIS